MHVAVIMIEKTFTLLSWLIQSHY